MGISGVIIAIIKIICVMLAVSAVFLLLMIPFLLLNPVRAVVTVKKKDRDTEARLRLKWLLGLFRFNLEYTGEDIEYELKYPLSGFMERRKNAKEKKDASKDTPVEGTILSNNTPSGENTAGDILTEKSDSPPKPENNTERDKESEEGSPENGLMQKLNKLRAVENKTLILKCFFENLKRLLKKIRFYRRYVKVDFGFTDPALTGEVLGLIYAVGSSFLTDTEINPHFDRQVLEADIDLEGRTNLLFVILPVLGFITNENVKTLLFKRR